MSPVAVTPSSPRPAGHVADVAVINHSTVVSADELAKALPAFQRQVSEDFAPAWGQDARLHLVAEGATPDPAMWQLVVLDDADQAGALGYHDVTPQWLPLGKVFAKTAKTYGAAWTVTFSHELLEMLGDPEVNLVAMREATAGVILYAFEACDACEADRFGYLIDGVLVSDFVTPSWFGGTPPYDHRGLIARPLQLLDGGYIGYWTAASGWRQKTKADEERSADQRPHVGSRRERRRTPKDQWITSTAGTAG